VATFCSVDRFEGFEGFEGFEVIDDHSIQKVIAYQKNEIVSVFAVVEALTRKKQVSACAPPSSYRHAGNASRCAGVPATQTGKLEHDLPETETPAGDRPDVRFSTGQKGFS
jgi:hypothetical protein